MEYLTDKNNVGNILKYSVSQIVLFATPYALVTASLYIFTYWSRFSINITEYIGVADFINMAFNAVFFFIVILVVVHMFMFVISNIMEVLDKKNTEKELTNAIEISETPNRNYYLLILHIIILTLVLYALFFVNEPNKWIPFAAGLSFLFASTLSNSKVIPFSGAYSFLWVLIIIPAFSFAKGKNDGYHIMYGPIEKHVMLVDNKNNNILSDNEMYRFIGYAGNHYFIYAVASGDVHIIESSSNIKLVIKTVY